MTVRVLMIDDDPDYRSGLAAMLGLADDIEVIGQASTADEGIELALADVPDAVLMDVRLDGTDGITATAMFADVVPQARVVVLTLFPDDTALFAALTAGAAGFCLKSASPDEIVRAIRSATRGGVPIDPAMTGALIARSQLTRNPEITFGLSRREQQVLELLGKGLTDAEIAHRLVIAIPTVRTYIERLSTKLGARGRTKLAIIASQYKAPLKQ